MQLGLGIIFKLQITIINAEIYFYEFIFWLEQLSVSKTNNGHSLVLLRCQCSGLFYVSNFLWANQQRAKFTSFITVVFTLIFPYLVWYLTLYKGSLLNLWLHKFVVLVFQSNLHGCRQKGADKRHKNPVRCRRYKSVIFICTGNTTLGLYNTSMQTLN